MGNPRDLGNLVDFNKVATEYTTSNPTAPSAGLVIFTRLRAGKRILSQISPIADTELQPNVGFKRVMYVEPQWGATASTFVGVPSQNGIGTTARSLTTGSFLGQTRRVGFVSSATAGSVAEIRQGTTILWRGNAATLGGFYVVMKFGTPSPLSGGIYFIGLSPGTTIAGTTESSALTDIIGVGKDTGDTNFQIMYNDASGTATKVDTGVAPATGQVYTLRIFCLPNDSVVYISLENVGTGSVIYDGSTSSNIPANTTLLGYIYHASNSATASAAAVDEVQFYAETN